MRNVESSVLSIFLRSILILDEGYQLFWWVSRHVKMRSLQNKKK